MYNFVDELKQNLSKSKTNVQEIILYLHDEGNEPSHMELKRLSQDSKVKIIIGRFMLVRDSFSRSDLKRFPELDWLPVHRLVLISLFHYMVDRDTKGFPLDKIPICFQSLRGLLMNPDFNRFDHNAKTLLPGVNLPKSVSKLTLLYVPNLETSKKVFDSREVIYEDTDAMLQLMVFLKHKLLQVQGANFYVVSVWRELPIIYQRLGFKVIQLITWTKNTISKGKNAYMFGLPLSYQFSDYLRTYYQAFICYDSRISSGGNSFGNNDVKETIKVYAEDILTDKSLNLFMDAITLLAD